MKQNHAKTYYCYKATNQVNGKVYIGFAADPEKRWSQHKRDAERGKGYIFHQAIRKHGWSNFQFEVLCCGTDKRAMLEHVEPQLIKQYNSSIPHGYNMHKKVLGIISYPIDIRRKRTLEERQALSEIMKRTHADPNVRTRISDGVRLAHHNSDIRKKQSQAAKNRFANGSIHGMLGRTHTPEARAKMSAARRGRVSPRKGVKLSDETKQKLRLANLGKTRHKTSDSQRSRFN